MAGDRDIQHQARRNRPVEPHRGELFGACHSAALGQHAATRADYDHAQAELEKRGIALDFMEHGIARSMYFKDPDGRKVEITTYDVK